MDPVVFDKSRKTEQPDAENPIVIDQIVSDGTPGVEMVSEPVPMLETARLQQQNASGRGGLFWSLIVGVPTVLVVLAFGAYWGYDKYEKTGRQIDISLLLPKDADVVARFVVDSEAPQMSLLNKNMMKFPGYDYLRKKMDKIGEGKDASESLLQQWKSAGLDFAEDIKPALGSVAYVVLPDIRPIEQLVGEELGSVAMPSLDHYAVGDRMPDSGRGRILGWSTIQTESAGMDHSAVLDFILTAQIRDLDKAKQALSKISSERYTVEHLTYEGYEYIKITLQKKAATDPESLQVSLRSDVTYHAALGMNWIVTSKEDWLREMVDRRLTRNMISFAEKKESLADNGKYSEIMSRLKSGEDHLVSAYYRWGAQQDCSGMGDVCKYLKDMGVYEGGFLLGVREDGFVVQTAVMNEMVQNKRKPNGYKTGFAATFPKQSQGLWGDVFYEMSDFKTAYYDFKRNYVTDEGLDEWNKGLDGIMLETGVHPERDVIDHMNGSVAFLLMTGNKKMPAPVLAMHVDGTAPLKRLLDMYVEKGNASASALRSALCDQQEKATLPGAGDVPADRQMQDFCSHEKRSVALVRLEERVKTSGTVFVIHSDMPTLVGGQPDEVALGVQGNDAKTLYLSSYVPIVEELVNAPVAATASLSQDGEYMFAEKYLGSTGSTRFHVVPLGVFYALSSLFDSVTSQDEALSAVPTEQMEARKREDERNYAIISFLRTLKSLSFQESENGSASVFLHIEELPKAEKERADAIFNGEDPFPEAPSTF